MNTNDIPKISMEAARVNAGLTQKKAAELIGIGISALQSYESGRTIPQWDVVEKIGKVYKYPISFICFDRKLAKSEFSAAQIR